MGSQNTVREKIINYMKANDLKVGDKLPSESALSEQIDVNRLTLRESLNVLRGEGLISTQHGTGTFISSDLKHISDTLNNNLGITEMIEVAGFKPGAKEFERELVVADEELSQKLGVKEGSDILVFKRVRTADNKPVIYSMDYIASSLVPEFLNITDHNVSFYQFIEEEMNLSIDNSIAEIIPVKCTPDLAVKLEYKVNEPLLKMKQKITDVKGNPLLYAVEYFRPDYFIILVNRRRRK